MRIEAKNRYFGLDKSESKTMHGRILYRVVALTSIPLMNHEVIEKDTRGGWCSEECYISERVIWCSENSTFWGGTFRGGTFWGGTFEGGTFRGGTFRGGTFRGGTFEGGTFWGGTFLGGTFQGGTFQGGTFWGGTFLGGTFQGGTFEGGTFQGGTFEVGTFQGGTFEGGTFQGGTFEVGTFLGGISCQKQPIFIAGLSWPITITDNHMTIGCQHHKLARWWKFSERQIAAMDSYATAFWKEHKEMLQALCAATGRASEGGA